MKMGVVIEGDGRVSAMLQAMPGRTGVNFLRVMANLGAELLAIVVNEKLSGQVLQRRSGKLAAAQTLRIENDGSSVTVSVGFDSTKVPYGRYQEFGVGHSWAIGAKKAAALRFEIAGNALFRKRVRHPPMKARPFLQSALDEIAPKVARAMRDGILR